MGAISGPTKYGEQRLKEQLFSSKFTRLVEQLPPSIWNVIGQVCKSGGHLGASPVRGHGPMPPRRKATGLAVVFKINGVSIHMMLERSY